VTCVLLFVTLVFGDSFQFLDPPTFDSSLLIPGVPAGPRARPAVPRPRRVSSHAPPRGRLGRPGSGLAGDMVAGADADGQKAEEAAGRYSDASCRRLRGVSAGSRPDPDGVVCEGGVLELAQRELEA
jgi:hypothetical protein